MPVVTNVPIAGDLPVAPTIRVQPTVQRTNKVANVGWQYRVRYTLTNNAARPLVNYPYAISLGATNSLVSNSKALSSGNDLRVVLDGREVARTLVTWNTGATSCWVVIPFCGAGQSVTYEVLYGNASAGTPPTLAYPELPAFDLATSTNSKWVYLVDRTSGNAGKGGWYLSTGASQPGVVDQTVPGAWQTTRTLGNEDDSSQDTTTSYVASGTTYWQGRFAARRGRGGSVTGSYRNNGDGVVITVPTLVTSVKCDLKWTNPEKGASGTDPVGRLVILTKAGENDDWVQLSSNTTAYNSETTIASATYTPAASVLTLAFAVWPYDAGAVEATAQSTKVAEGHWNSVLELNVTGSSVAQATAQAETAVYELATEVRQERDGGDNGALYTAVRFGNQQQGSGAGTPRLTLALNQYAVVDTTARRCEVWDSGLSARVEVASPAVVSAVDGVVRQSSGSAVEQAAGYWLTLAPAVNPLTNPSFDSDVAGWERGTVTAGQTVGAQTRNTTTYDSSPAGLSSQITASTAASGAVVEDRAADYLPVAGRKRVWFAAAVRSTSVNLQPTLTIWFYDASNVLVGSAQTEANWTVTADTWVRRVFGALVPTGATQFKVGVTAKSKADNTTGTVFTDTVTVCDNDLTYSDVSVGSVGVSVVWTEKYA